MRGSNCVYNVGNAAHRALAEQGYTMNRTTNLLNAFGFQGGTIHQVAELTGCDAFDLLYADTMPYEFHRQSGWFAYRTNEREFNRNNRTPAMQGNVQYWIGVAEGVETTRKQGLPVVAKF